MKTVYVLLADGDGTMHSRNEPFGVAVNFQSEAEQFVKENKDFGYSVSYCAVNIFDTKDEALDWYRNKK